MLKLTKCYKHLKFILIKLNRNKVKLRNPKSQKGYKTAPDSLRHSSDVILRALLCSLKLTKHHFNSDNKTNNSLLNYYASLTWSINIIKINEENFAFICTISNLRSWLII